jgi:hypothetical protein
MSTIESRPGPNGPVTGRRDPPNNTKTLVNPNKARAWCSPKIAAS